MHSRTMHIRTTHMHTVHMHTAHTACIQPTQAHHATQIAHTAHATPVVHTQHGHNTICVHTVKHVKQTPHTMKHAKYHITTHLHNVCACHTTCTIYTTHVYPHHYACNTGTHGNTSKCTCTCYYTLPSSFLCTSCHSTHRHQAPHNTLHACATYMYAQHAFNIHTPHTCTHRYAYAQHTDYVDTYIYTFGSRRPSCLR